METSRRSAAGAETTASGRKRRLADPMGGVFEVGFKKTSVKALHRMWLVVNVVTLP